MKENGRDCKVPHIYHRGRGAAARIFLKAIIYLYRVLLSPLIPPRCRFLPTCSQYALDAIDRYGPYKGSKLALKRLCRCHPWGGHGFDPVKEDEP